MVLEAIMSIHMIYKIAAVGILISILSQVLKHSGRDEQAFLISLAGLILVLSWIVPCIYELFQTVEQMFALLEEGEMLKIACVGLIAVFLAMSIKNIQSEYAVLVSVAACIVLFAFSVTRLEVIFQSFQQIQTHLSVHSTYIRIIAKVIGVAYISEFSANLCKDAGYGGIASQIEMFGKLSILAMSIPVLTALLTTIQEFLDYV